MELDSKSRHFSQSCDDVGRIPLRNAPKATMEPEPYVAGRRKYHACRARFRTNSFARAVPRLSRDHSRRDVDGVWKMLEAESALSHARNGDIMVATTYRPASSCGNDDAAHAGLGLVTFFHRQTLVYINRLVRKASSSELLSEVSRLGVVFHLSHALLVPPLAFSHSPRTMSLVSEPPPDLCCAFHHHIRDGNIEGMTKLLDDEPSLVNARTADRSTPLMVATSHPDTERALEMMKLLRGRGAHVGRKDRHLRQALFYACMQNADVAVVQTLLDWYPKQVYRNFQWSGCLSRGQTASLMVSELENTPVTKLLLDKVEHWWSAKANHSGQVLKVAIESGNEKHAMEVALHPAIRICIKRPEMTRSFIDGAERAWTISSCIGAAVDRRMLDLVQVFYQLNKRYVSREVWFKIHDLVRATPNVLAAMPRSLTKIGMHFINAWRWQQVRDICLARYGCKQDEEEGLATLPDDVFHQIVAFLIPPAFHLVPDDDYDHLWRTGSNLVVFWGCHTRYEPARTMDTSAAVGPSSWKIRLRRLLHRFRRRK